MKEKKQTQYAHDWEGAVALIKWLVKDNGKDATKSANKWLKDLPDFDHMVEFCQNCGEEVSEYNANMEWLMESVKDAMFLGRNVKYMAEEIKDAGERLKAVVEKELKCRKISTSTKGNGKKRLRIDL